MTEANIEVCCAGLEKGEAPEPCVMVIFGATGDLTRGELLPSLYELFCKDLLPRPFFLVGFARREWSHETFRERMRDAVQRSCRFREDRWRDFATSLTYVRGEFGDGGAYAALNDALRRLRKEHNVRDNVFFHLATPSSVFAEIAIRLRESGLSKSDGGYRRLVVEKPFGRDRGSARELDRKLREAFAEKQIYRIDHYLGKETVQNMLVFRFANASFEPIWNRHHIDHIQITAAEDVGIGTRGSFYEKTGAVRDMVQNHLLQLLCMVATEPPLRFDGSAMRDATIKVLEAIAPVRLDGDIVLGQYGPGAVNGARVPGYRNEENVAPDSSVPTYAALRLHVDNWRWADVPFYLRTGKRLKQKLTEIVIQFKPTPHLMFPLQGGALESNLLVFRLAPEEGILHAFTAKQPGPGFCLQPVRMNFLYAQAFDVKEIPRAYAWLLHDVMQGDPTLFARADWIERSWALLDPSIEEWEKDPRSVFPNYDAGSWGPDEADRLLQRDGHSWHAL